MKDMGDHYDYIAVYVDDLLIASKDPKAIIEALESDPINFKLKGTGPLSFHLGCDYFRDVDGTRATVPRSTSHECQRHACECVGLAQAPSTDLCWPRTITRARHKQSLGQRWHRPVSIIDWNTAMDDYLGSL